MNIFDELALLPKISPLLPRITKGIAFVEKLISDPAAQAALIEAQKIMADPELKDALDTAKELAVILESAGFSTPTSSGQEGGPTGG